MRPVATLSAVAAAKFDQTTTLSITDNPWVTRKIRPGAAWFVALLPSSPVQLVTRACRNGITVSAFGVPRTQPASSTSGSIREGPRDGQPIAQFAQKSGSMSAWTPATFDRAAS